MPVGLAGTDRVGHAVDLAHGRRPGPLLARMRRQHVLVETPLISHAQILRVRGDRHPLRTYLAAGVPVALATDDPGVSRSDLTAVFRRAVTDQGLTVGQLRQAARASLDRAFFFLWAQGGAACVRGCGGARMRKKRGALKCAQLTGAHRGRRRGRCGYGSGCGSRDDAVRGVRPTRTVIHEASPPLGQGVRRICGSRDR
ncbi:hypothetical protein [Streptomyces sp. H27-C3]|uniref:hypothetical protein n=1 Tax=Streptomyces sp. H27-C3 TaxID=3046305 RepID=UPI0024BA2EAB|nr:hypothetical protein [Streptomyces sp. H27-C3]MDJ0462451.1 hypothetical protein [Streptomyces sp. H27-C3]